MLKIAKRRGNSAVEGPDALKVAVIVFVWLVGHALIPLAVVVYVIAQVVRTVWSGVNFLIRGTRLLLIGLLTRVSRLSPERRSAAEAQKKFAFVSHVLPPEWSGQAVVIKRILEGIEPSEYCLISSQNYDSSLLRDFIGRLPGAYYWLPIELHIPFLQRTTVVRRLNLITAVIIRGYRIAYLLVASGCRTVVAASGDPVDLPASYVAACITGARFVPYLFDDSTYQWPAEDGRKEARFIERVIFRRASAAIVPNEFLQREIVGRHPGMHVSIVRNPTEGLITEKDIAAKRDGGEGASKTIVYTGAIYHVNLNAFKNLMAALNHEGMPRLELHLYAAQSKGWLEKEGISGPRVVLHGHVPPEEVGRVQERADILFMGFSFDSAIPELVATSAPGKLGDYLACGVPILAHVPRDSFVAWYMRKYECGVVVDKDSPDVLTRAIKEILTDAALRSRLRENALMRARADFDPSVARSAFLAALRRESQTAFS